MSVSMQEGKKRSTSYDETCPSCGISYRDFRTGLTYRDVYEWYWSGSLDPKEWKYKRRSTILGKWWQYKNELWEEHVHTCRQESENADRSRVPLRR